MAVSSDRLITDRERAADWVRARIPHILEWGDWYQAMAMERDGRIIAGAVYNHYTGFDISIHIAVEVLTRSCIEAAFGYPFRQLKAQRITAPIASRNKESRRLAEHMGFVYEGKQRRALLNDDLLIYGMTLEECRWVKMLETRMPRISVALPA